MFWAHLRPAMMGLGWYQLKQFIRMGWVLNDTYSPLASVIQWVIATNFITTSKKLRSAKYSAIFTLVVGKITTKNSAPNRF